jgi:hypothetical protein
LWKEKNGTFCSIGALRAQVWRRAGCGAWRSGLGNPPDNLTLARGYVKKLLDNAKVVRFLNGDYGDVLAEFERLAAAEGV